MDILKFEYEDRVLLVEHFQMERERLCTYCCTVKRKLKQRVFLDNEISVYIPPHKNAEPRCWNILGTILVILDKDNNVKYVNNTYHLLLTQLLPTFRELYLKKFNTELPLSINAAEVEMTKYGFTYNCDVTDGNGNYATLRQLLPYGDGFIPEYVDISFYNNIDTFDFNQIPYQNMKVTTHVWKDKKNKDSQC